MLKLFDIFEPFTVLLALLPLIGYLLVLSAIRLSGRAIVTTGGRDIAALAVAISGLLAVGPAELFFPVGAATLFGPVVWFALAAFYGLSVSLVALSVAPKLVVYGRTPEELFEPLLASAQRIDSNAAGDASSLQVFIPSLEVHLRLDGQRSVDYTQVIAFEPNLPLQFWSQLLGHLRHQVEQQSAPMPRRGFVMLVVAICFSAFLFWQSFSNGELVVQGFRDWLWR